MNRERVRELLARGRGRSACRGPGPRRACLRAVRESGPRHDRSPPSAAARVPRSHLRRRARRRSRSCRSPRHIAAQRRRRARHASERGSGGGAACGVPGDRRERAGADGVSCRNRTSSKWGGARCCIVTAGTSDLPVAEEAAVTAAALGNTVARITDVGVAGHPSFARAARRIAVARRCSSWSRAWTARCRRWWADSWRAR